MTETAGAARRDSRGFTLVEVLVAFAILALSFAALMQAFSGGLRLLSASGARTEALRLAESRLSEAGRSAPLAPGTASGEEGRYRWRLDVTPYDDGEGAAAQLPPVYLVTVTVSWGINKSLSLSTADFGQSPHEQAP